MSSIASLLTEIETRPAMYIGQRSISCLAAFIDGWSYGLKDTIDDGDVFRRFDKWLRERYEITSNRSWDQIIRFYTSDEHDALNAFFTLWHEFLAGEEVHRCEGTVSDSAPLGPTEKRTVTD